MGVVSGFISKLADTFFVPVPDNTIIKSSSGRSVRVNLSPIEEEEAASMDTLEAVPVGEVVYMLSSFT